MTPVLSRGILRGVILVFRASFIQSQLTLIQVGSV
jgi:hypothetical protein